MFSSLLNFVQGHFLAGGADATFSAFPSQRDLDLIERYKQGVINSVSALHLFAKTHHLQLELKETSVAGKHFCYQIKWCLLILESIRVDWGLLMQLNLVTVDCTAPACVGFWLPLLPQLCLIMRCYRNRSGQLALITAVNRTL